jgi:uncharacterized BrkB/YihY/UPF0761 family membrane protein
MKIPQSGTPRNAFLRFLAFTRSVLAEYARNHGQILAKGLGFSLLLGLIPLILLLVIVGRQFIDMGELEQMAETILYFLPETARQTLVDQIARFGQNGGEIPIITFGIFAIVIYNLFGDLKRVIGTFLPRHERPHPFGGLIPLVLLGGFTVLFYALSALLTASNYLTNILDLPPTGVFWAARALATILFAAILLALFYLFAGYRLRFGRTLSVSLAAGVVWNLISTAGSVVVRSAGTRFLLYGAIAGAVVVLVYMRLLAELIIFTSILAGKLSPVPNERARVLLEDKSERE